METVNQSSIVTPEQTEAEPTPDTAPLQTNSDDQRQEIALHSKQQEIQQNQALWQSSWQYSTSIQDAEWRQIFQHSLHIAAQKMGLRDLSSTPDTNPAKWPQSVTSTGALETAGDNPKSPVEAPPDATVDTDRFNEEVDEDIMQSFGSPATLSSNYGTEGSLGGGSMSAILDEAQRLRQKRDNIGKAAAASPQK